METEKKSGGRRRGRSPHPGVVIFKKLHRSGSHTYVARWTEPATGQHGYQSLTNLGLKNEAGRRDWAIRKAAALTGERVDLTTGGVPQAKAPESLRAAMQEYLALCEERLRTKTILGYREDLIVFQDFAASIGVSKLNQLCPPHLAGFRDHLTKLKKNIPVKGADRGARHRVGGKVSRTTMNGMLKSVSAFLNAAHQHGQTLHLGSDDIKIGLKRFAEPRPRPQFLRPPEIRAVLEAALRHDQATYSMTRLERDTLKVAGTTPRHKPIAPYALATLLTGCRANELLSLSWDLVHLHSASEGEIIIPASTAKTHRERSVDLAVCPSLIALFQALRAATPEHEYVFGNSAPLPWSAVEKARLRLKKRYHAPDFSWQRMRQTCATFLVNAPGIYGGASAYRAASQLGHSVTVAERNYVGTFRQIPKDAETLEAAMDIEDLARRIIELANSSAQQGRTRSNAEPLALIPSDGARPGFSTLNP